jgi:geranylgeranyl diphosphate synthase type I
MQMKTESKSKEVELFAKKLKSYKKLIDADIAQYSKLIKKSTLQNYGAHSRLATDAYLEILARGGKRIRGALAMVGYEMMGGKNQNMILVAARALEMIHAYLLIMDDIQDRSLTRRGGPTAHVDLSLYHQVKHLSGDADHFGISLALNAMGIGNHAAQVLVANLDAPEDVRLKALSILNQSIVITAHGQTSDIMNEVNGPVTMKDVENVLEWKTAHYTFLNPLTFGMVLADADCAATDAVRDYALNAGRAFQITDDILGTFGHEFTSGKSPMDDMREGKRTVLTLYALEHAEKADKNFLIQMLGNQHLTQAEFDRCKDILIETGAYEFAAKQADDSIEKAISSLKKQNIDWNQESVNFLIGLAQYLKGRSS